MLEFEKMAWEDSLKEGVFTLPSHQFHMKPCGYFRICFTPLDEEAVLEGINRLFIGAKKESLE